MPDAAAADISAWIERLTRRPPSRRSSSPDVLEQLKQTLRRPVDRLLCIAADPDSTLKILSGVLADHPADVRRGIALIEQMTSRRSTLVEIASGQRLGYPNLHPSLLIRRHFRRRLRPHKLPTDVGVLLFDAITAFELAADERGETPDLPVVIDDHTTGRRHRLSAAKTAGIESVLDAAGVTTVAKNLFEGPLVRRRLIDPARMIGESDLWLHVEYAAPPVPAAACTRCGECVSACPVDLHPAALLEAAQADDRDMAHAFAAAACIECGLCTQVCPPRLPVMESIRKLQRPPAEAVL